MMPIVVRIYKLEFSIYSERWWGWAGSNFGELTPPYEGEGCLPLGGTGINSVALHPMNLSFILQ